MYNTIIIEPNGIASQDDKHGDLDGVQDPSIDSVGGYQSARRPRRGARGRGGYLKQYGTRPPQVYRGPRRRSGGVRRQPADICVLEALKSGEAIVSEDSDLFSEHCHRGYSEASTTRAGYWHGNPGRHAKAKGHAQTSLPQRESGASLHVLSKDSYQPSPRSRGFRSNRFSCRGNSPTRTESYLHSTDERHADGKRELGDICHDLSVLQTRDSDILFSQPGKTTKHRSRGGSSQHFGRGGSAQRNKRARGKVQRGGGGRGGASAVGYYDFNSHRGGVERGGHSFVNHRGKSQSRPQHNRYQGETKYMTQEDIERLVRSDSQEVIQYITENEGGFLASFCHQPTCHHHLSLKQLIKLLYLLVKSDDNQLAARIVAEIFSDRATGPTDTSVFNTCLDTFVRKMPMETSLRGLVHINTENPQYLSYLIEIGTFAISAVPLSVMYTFPYLAINDTVQKITQVGGDDVHLLVPKALSLVEDFTKAQKDRIPQPSPSQSGIDTSAPPPQPFTELSVLPTTDEIHPYAAKPYLRPNITKGGYTDWEHYLDVQFRLTREDFVAPLRDGIRTLELKGAASKSLSDVRVYEGVRLLNTECLISGIGFQIKFNVKKFQKVNWEHSKRLIFGSLLCLSRDNFRTIYFATVVNRDPKHLKYGLVTVRFEGDQVEDVFQIDPNERFVMVESTAYFEAYRHILEGIKRASELHLTDRLQIFKKYLVDCRVETPLPMPRYLLISDKYFRLKDVLGITSSRPDVIVTDDSSWPPLEHTNFDASQLCAFRAALTQEVSVIQGPPGTGKTFIGLKVVEALVANKGKFQSNNFPILVLCYTNHALDQFLEGIISIETQESKELNIIRIGGRCKTESLEKYVLKSKINAIRSQKLLPHYIAKHSSNCRRAVLKHKETIEFKQRSQKAIESRDKVLKLYVLANYIHVRHLCQLTQERPTQLGREIDVWLQLWYVHGEEDPPPEEEKGEDPPPEEEKGEDPPPEEEKGEEPPPEEEEEELLSEDYEDIIDSQSESDDEFIQVDAEAKLLEDERMLDGEEIEMRNYRNHVWSQLNLFAPNTYKQKQEDESEWSVVQIKDDERHRRIMRGHSNQPMSPSEANAVTNIWHLSLKRRWSLYLHWVNELIRANKMLIAEEVLGYNEACKEYTKSRQEIDAYVIKTADIVGMTTTGAAKYNHILSNMLPKVVIIEEAAEVFEAHVFTSLTPSVQQLIMIGDHKQLRPKANCYNLEKNYEFCVSLFERLARNGFPVHTLEVQHRMRPEIASLICPSIYEKLLNNENVERYDHVKGVGSDVFFIDHTYPEKANEDRERSHSNLHEADFIVALCKYLLQQGYHPSEITVLTMYRGQLLELKKRMLKKDYNGVRVAAVDDFQGEENEIILLSLVRSNSDGIIGFLSIENRICVSLSRAKIGFFVIGNLSMLRDKDSTVWPQILADLSKRGCVGKALPLYCQVHPNIKVMASTAENFEKCPEGGCRQNCLFRFNCGHSCPRLCHPSDQKHVETKCKQYCPKVLAGCGHSCRYQCFECIERCPPCSEPVVRTILCGHEVKMPCHQHPSTFECTQKCSQKLNCGHKCTELCSELCTTRCRKHEVETLPCGHTQNIPCYLDASIAKCHQPCDTFLDCGHKCPGRCGRCQRGRLHVCCQSKCVRTLVCSHVCNFPCTPSCPPCMEDCINYCSHNDCKRKCYEPCKPCRKPCIWKCKHYRCSRLCSEMCDRPPCDKPCKKYLECGHPCIGLCGEKCPTKCRVCDVDLYKEDKDARFIQLEECGHVIEVTACDTWMNRKDNGSKPSEVQFKCCPKCKTQIRKSLRYGNIVKQTLQDFENIKKKQCVNLRDNLLIKFHEVDRKVQKVSSPLLSKLVEQFKFTKRSLQRSMTTNSEQEPSIPPHRVNKINVQLSYSTIVVTMIKHLSLMESTTSVCDSLTELGFSIEGIHDDIKGLVEFLVQIFPSDQQMSDIESELYRLVSLIRLSHVWCKIRSIGNVTEVDRLMLRSKIQTVRESGWKTDKLKEKDHDEIVKFVTKMSEKYKVDSLTDAERIEPIVKAIGLTKGHWFKCPNGHYYCIGECGGATEEAECPECGAMVGGQQHTLQECNQLSTEMDAGAQFEPD